MGDRADWHTYFMNIARQVATRSTCDRKHVGAVIVRDRTILSTGYNGSIRGLPHCNDVGHLMESGHCVRTVHAEANAIAQAALGILAQRRGYPAVFVAGGVCAAAALLMLALSPEGRELPAVLPGAQPSGGRGGSA